jgi:hypothetical protein
MPLVASRQVMQRASTIRCWLYVSFRGGALTNHVVEVVDDHLGVAGGVHRALQERRPRAQLRLLQTRILLQTFHIKKL